MADAAHQLATLIRGDWPWVDDDPQIDLRIVPELQGYRGNKAIDLVVMAQFGSRAVAPAIPGLHLFGDQPFAGKKVRFETLVLVIEIKEHPSPCWRLTGSKVEVLYNGKWHDASEQSYRQVSSLRDYFLQRNAQVPYIMHCLWLRGARREEFKKNLTLAHPVWAGNDSWLQMLNCIMAWSRLRAQDGTGVISCLNNHQVKSFTMLANLLTNRVTGTPMVLRQLDNVIRGTVRQEWLDALGHKQIHLRGRAGTGKTAVLLQLARAVTQRPCKSGRVLLLTFNRTLTTNLIRSLNLLEPGDAAISSTIRCCTQDKYFQAVFAAAGLGRARGTTAEEFQAEMNQRIAKACHWVRGLREAGQKPRATTSDDNWPFEFDYLFVDEAQDVPDNAHALLRELFKPSHTVVADGVDQIVRREKPCDWEKDLDASQSLIVNLDCCLRMKANLARFANAVARHLGLAWRVEPALEMPGGRVILRGSDYFADRGLHEHLLQANAEVGNCPLDMLMCLPRDFIERDEKNHYLGILPDIRAVLEQWNQPVWDATNEDNRDNIMQQPGDLRVVPYTSCRGLEGWTVMLIRPDSFFERHLEKEYEQAKREAGSTGCLADADTVAKRAALYMMIPLTRAMDTLVITLQPDAKSAFAKAVRAAANECIDFVEHHASA